MSNAPTVSVIMAAYNGAALIGETIASLRAQNFTDWELVVVDDCSTDATREVIAAIDDPRIRASVNAANAGPVRTRNQAFSLTRGRYVAGLDQDDLCHPDRLAAQVAYLDTQPDVALVATAAQELRGTEVVASQLSPVTTPALIGWLLHLQNPLVWSSTMFRADTVRRLDVMTRPELLYAEDFDLYHRLSKLGRIARLDRELVTYRSHPGGASQKFETTMYASAERVLTEVYTPIFGEGAARAADLVLHHVMGRRPVPDGDTLRAVGDTIAALQQHYLTQARPDRESQWLIRWETARLWARIGRAALRSGKVSFGDRLGARPDHLGLGHAGFEELVASGIVGAARNVRARSRA
ncbi:MAG: glycosyltransferase family A protein [Pseudomonadota bacterium]